MALDLAAPEVPFLDENNVLDIDDLAGQALNTTIRLQGATPGHYVHPNWRGTAADGLAHDFTDVFEIASPNDVILVAIPNPTLVALDQGHVLYSYTVQPTAQFAEGYPDSRRVAILVGKRAFSGSGLNVAVIKQAHQLRFNGDDLPDGGVTVGVSPWQAMQAGDRLTTVWNGYRFDGGPQPELRVERLVQAEDVGLPMQLALPASPIHEIEGGYGYLNYWIEYLDSTTRTVAPRQRFDIQPAPAQRLPALTILEQTGPDLDPELMAAGMTFSIERYPDLRDGDTLMIFAENPSTRASQTVISVRLDRSSIDSGLIRCVVEGDWLWDYLDQRVSLSYHIARPGVVLAADPLVLPVRLKMLLPAPMVKDAGPTGEVGQADYKALSGRDGVEIRVPTAAVFPVDAWVEMHWEGVHEDGTSVVPGDPAAPYTVPARFVAPNIGKRVRVFYRVQVEGEPPRDSLPLVLNILPIPAGAYRDLVCEQAVNGELRVVALGRQGSDQRQPPWPLIAAGQYVRLEVTGTLNGGGTERRQLMTDRVVTTPEVNIGVSEWLDKAWLERMQLNSFINFTVQISADRGASYTRLAQVSIKLI